MSTNESAPVVKETDQHERTLLRRISKSKLSKQAEVVDTDGPFGVGGTQSQSVPEVRTPVKTNVILPETRVESYDGQDVSEENMQTSMLKAKQGLLVRGNALCGDDDTKLNAKGLEKQCSSKNSSQTSSLSRDSSNELYTDSTGTNLEEFIIGTLHKNQKDRQLLLELEQRLIDFVQDANKNVYKFPAMSSYNRMLVHRVAAFFGLDHNVDQSQTAVVVNKNKTTRIPDCCFKDYVRSDVFTEDSRKVLLRRDNASCEEARISDQVGMDRKTRSFDDREDDYERIRSRIFNHSQDVRSPSSVDGILESPLSGNSSEGPVQMSTRPWSSTDSSTDGCGNFYMQRGHLGPKADSFGGVPMYREIHKLSPRRCNTESGDPSGMSSLMCQIPMRDQTGSPLISPGQQVIFAVASIEQVPPGAILINPQTGLPYCNPDGSPLRCSPALMPMGTQRSSTPTLQPVSPAPSYDTSGLASPMQMLSVNSGCPRPVSPVFLPQSAQPHPSVYTYVVPSHHGSASDMGQACSSQNYMDSAYGTPVQYQQQMPYYGSYGEPSGVPTHASYSQNSPIVYPVFYPMAMPVGQVSSASHSGMLLAVTPGQPLTEAELSPRIPSPMPFTPPLPSGCFGVDENDLSREGECFSEGPDSSVGHNSSDT